MKTLLTLNIIVFAIVAGAEFIFGFDPKKWHTWLFGVYGFLSILGFGLSETGRIDESLMASSIVILALMFIGVTTRWSRERAKKYLRERYKEDE